MIGVHKDNEGKSKAVGSEPCRFGRWYLAEEECGNVAGSRSVKRRVCGETGREALALDQKARLRRL